MKKFDVNKPLEARGAKEGVEVQVFLSDDTSPAHSILGAFRYKDKPWKTMTWYSDGMALDTGTKQSYDLVNIVVKVTQTGWLNIYSEQRNGNMLHATKEGADLGASRGRIACVPVTFTFEEGDGL